ncbi:hypothetical protein MHH70_03640 [Metasolibacillus sp. FSL H7-0170]|uniref:hypothetical protein n=1 Tax=Metasolibacillus sp. FSL H7-0170 TaxID=2921431 RepID=UPI0031583622
MKLDERLQQITRVEWDEKQRQRQKESIKAQHLRTTRKQLFARQLAIASIACILLLFYFIDVKHEEQVQQQIQLTDELQQLTVLSTTKPERNLNLNSVMYMNKRSTNDPQLLKDFQRIITDVTVIEQAWDGQLPQQIQLYQLLLTFQNGQQLYLKFASNYGERFELYDVYGGKKYVLTNEEDVSALYILFERILNQTVSTSWKKYAWIAFFSILIIDAAFISKNRYTRDEDGKKKSLHWSWKIMYSVIFVTPLIVSSYYLGTVHIGLIAGGLVLSLLLAEYFEVKKGIKRANWLWAFMTMFFVISAIVLILI